MKSAIYTIVIIVVAVGAVLLFRQVLRPQPPEPVNDVTVGTTGGQSEAANGSDADATESGSDNQETITVFLTAEGFQPSELTVKKNTKVLFTNQDSVNHWPASDPHPIHTDYAAFDPREPLAPGESWTFVFSQTGIWQFHDHLHPSFTGTVTVEE